MVIYVLQGSQEKMTNLLNILYFSSFCGSGLLPLAEEQATGCVHAAVCLRICVVLVLGGPVDECY